MICRFTAAALREQRRAHIRETDALQDTHDPPVVQAVHDALHERRVGDAVDVPPGEERESVDEEPEQEDQQSATNDLAPDRRLVVAARAARRQREVRRDAGDEQEEREDEIGRRPAVPRRVLERRVDGAPGSRVVDEQHSRDGETAENVEREEALASAPSPFAAFRGRARPARRAVRSMPGGRRALSWNPGGVERREAERS